MYPVLEIQVLTAYFNSVDIKIAHVENGQVKISTKASTTITSQFLS